MLGRQLLDRVHCRIGSFKAKKVLAGNPGQSSAWMEYEKILSNKMEKSGIIAIQITMANDDEISNCIGGNAVDCL